MMSSEPFTIHDTTFDLDQNNIGLDPLPAGTYNPLPAAGEFVIRDVENKGGRNGARGPGFMQLDLRTTYRIRLGGRRSLDVYGEIFNVTNHANFVTRWGPSECNGSSGSGPWRSRGSARVSSGLRFGF
jgi:hypothetical protein